MEISLPPDNPGLLQVRVNRYAAEVNSSSTPPSASHAAVSPEIEPGEPMSGWPLTPLEEFLWLNDEPAHPMVFRVYLLFTGTGVRDALDESYGQVLARHPFLMSCVKTSGSTSQLQLLPARGIEWHDEVLTEEAFSKIPIESIDITRDPGFRTRIYRAPAGLWVMLDTHHVSSDGQGVRQFATEWFAAYWKMTGGANRQLPELQPERLLTRDQYPAVGKPVGFLEGMRNLIHTISGRTARIVDARPVGTPPLPADAPASWLVERVLSVEQTLQIREHLRQANCTMNDLGLTAAMFAFAQQFPREARGKLVTIINPVDLRRPSDLRLPACNRLGFAFVRRRVSAKTSFTKLIQDIHEEMRYVKERHVGDEFPKGLQLVRAIPDGIRRMIHWGWFTPTLLFTCLGDTTSLFRHKKPAEAGVLGVPGLQLERISGYAPQGHNVPLSLTACETNSRHCLTVRAATAALTQDQAAALANAFADHALRGALQLQATSRS